MNPEQFIECMNHPEKLDDTSIVRFSEIVREYPFCQAAQLLYLKSLQNEGNIRFNRQLKIAAAYAPDRKSLFELLHVAKLEEEGVEAQPYTSQTQAYRPLPVDTVIPESANPPEETERAPADYGDEYPRSEMVRRVEEFLPLNDLDLLLFDFPISRDQDLPDPESQRKTPQYRPDAMGETAEIADETNSRDLVSEFLLLDPLSQPRMAEPVVFPPTGTPPPVRMEAPSAEEILPNETIIPRPPKKGSDLIDTFINRAGSRVLRPDNEPLSGDDRSLESLREDEEILTDTLAKIFVQQGYYLKAIHSYEKLSLKFPEKSVYFASQIEMVRELIKNQ